MIIKVVQPNPHNNRINDTIPMIDTPILNFGFRSVLLVIATARNTIPINQSK